MGSRILLVDDDAQILKLYALILRNAGYDVQIEESSQRAVKAIQAAGQIDLLILDLSMPPPDGFEVLKRVRELRPGLRILVMSGFMDGKLLKAAAILGATATFNKAEPAAKILEAVTRILSI